VPPRARLVAVDGPSASGKSTVVARLARTQDWVPLAEAYDRTTPPIDLHFSSLPELARIERTLLEEEANRWTVARALLHRGWSVIADTGFLGPLTYTRGLVGEGLASPGLLSELAERAQRLALRRRWGLPDLTVYLQVPERLRRERARLDRAHHPPDLYARHEAVARREAFFYETEWPSIDRSAVYVVPAAGPTDRIAARVAERVRRSLPRGTAARHLPRLLATLSVPPGALLRGTATRSSATVKKTTRPAHHPRR